jgi:hypothetical protein
VWAVLNVDLADLLTGAIPVETGSSLDAEEVPYWRNLHLRRKSDFDIRKARRQMEGALRESPPPSLLYETHPLSIRDPT